MGQQTLADQNLLMYNQFPTVVVHDVWAILHYGNKVDSSVFVMCGHIFVYSRPLPSNEIRDLFFRGEGGCTQARPTVDGDLVDHFCFQENKIVCSPVLL